MSELPVKMGKIEEIAEKMSTCINIIRWIYSQGSSFWWYSKGGVILCPQDRRGWRAQ